MAQNQITLMDPPIEELLDKVDSKFTLVALASRRARQVNSYYNSLGEGLGVVVPPQVASASGKPLSIAFEEVAAGKATYSRPDPEEVALAEAAALALLEGEGAESADAADSAAIRLRRDGRLAGRTRPATGRDDDDTDGPGMTSRRDGDAPFVVLGVSAGIAAYKAVEVCRRLVDAGIHVAPVLTDAAHAIRGTGHLRRPRLGADPDQLVGRGLADTSHPAGPDGPIWWWWPRPPPTCWPGMPAALPTISSRPR